MAKVSPSRRTGSRRGDITASAIDPVGLWLGQPMR
jgi:hypothetical protein